MKNIFFLILVLVIIKSSLYSHNKITLYNSFLSYPDIDNIAYSFFPESLFNDKSSKIIWIDKLQAIYRGYKKNFLKIEFFYNEKEFDAIFYLKNNEKFYFCDGKMLPEDKINYKDNYNDYFYKYPQNSNNIYSRYLLSKTNEYDFYYSIYGKDKNKISNNLVRVNILKYRIYFNKNNNAINKLKKIIISIEKSPSLKEYFAKKIKSIHSFYYRNILYQEKLSLHSFGIAIDIMPRNRNKFIYWYWSIPFVKEWWNIRESDKISIPEELIAIFESNFFCWGGRWKRFDIMHFEYKPEIFYRRVKF